MDEKPELRKKLRNLKAAIAAGSLFNAYGLNMSTSKPFRLEVSRSPAGPVFGPTGNVEYDPTRSEYSTPEPKSVQERVEDMVTGGRGILPEQSTLYDTDTLVRTVASEEDKLQRALLKMDVRDGKVPKSDLTKFDMNLMGIFESTPCSGFYSYKSKDGSEFGVGFKSKF